MRLTKYRAFIVERYLEIKPEISIEDYCNNICTTLVKKVEFEKWLNLYYQIKESDNTKIKIDIVKPIDTTKNSNPVIKSERQKQKQSNTKNTPEAVNSNTHHTNIWILNKELKDLKDELRITKQFLELSTYSIECHDSKIRRLLEIIKDKKVALINSNVEIQKLKSNSSMEKYKELSRKLSKSENDKIRLEKKLRRFENKILNLKLKEKEKSEIIINITDMFTDSDICKNIIRESVLLLSESHSSNPMLTSNISSNNNGNFIYKKTEDTKIFLENFSECISEEAIKYYKSTKKYKQINIPLSIDHNAFAIDPTNFSVEFIGNTTKEIS